MSENRQALNAVLLSIVIIPLLKILMGAFSIEKPLYLIPFLFSSSFYFFTKLKNIFLDNRFKVLNGVIFVFFIKSLFWDTVFLDGLTIRFYASYFLIPNLLLSFFIFETKNNEMLIIFFKYLKFSALVISVLSLISLLLFYFKGFRFDFLKMFYAENILRTSVEAREKNLYILNILNHFNPGLISDRLNRGPQAIIMNFSYIFLIIVFWNKIKIKKWDYFLLIMSSFLLIMQNSRAMLLTLLLVLCFNFLSRRIHLRLLRPLFFVSILFPFFLLFLKDSFLNGRERQYKIFLNDLTLFGNGVGSGARVLLREIKGYYTFDNAHFEFIYNLGLLPYLFLMLFVYRFLIVKYFNFYSAYLLILLTVFHSLNFNLFDPYFFIIWFLLASGAIIEKNKISAL